MEKDRRDLDDPEYAAFAWGRFRRILGGMALVSLGTALVAEAVLYWSLGELNFVTASATFLGVFLTMMLTAALMGLMFLSSGSGHDERIEDRLRDEIDLD
jgi:peptidoglycan/LPS O-acetylase OafA/YrhL